MVVEDDKEPLPLVGREEEEVVVVEEVVEEEVVEEGDRELPRPPVLRGDKVSYCPHFLHFQMKGMLSERWPMDFVYQ